MTRFDELMAAVENNTNLIPLIKEMVYLEGYLDELRELPKIKVDPERPDHQKATPAAKQYKEYLQQYINIVKVVLRASGTDQTDEESPLRKWMNAHVDH
jgi:hypothetical protein